MWNDFFVVADDGWWCDGSSTYRWLQATLYQLRRRRNYWWWWWWKKKNCIGTMSRCEMPSAFFQMRWMEVGERMDTAVTVTHLKFSFLWIQCKYFSYLRIGKRGGGYIATFLRYNPCLTSLYVGPSRVDNPSLMTSLYVVGNEDVEMIAAVFLRRSVNAVVMLSTWKATTYWRRRMTRMALASQLKIWTLRLKNVHQCLSNQTCPFKSTFSHGRFRQRLWWERWGICI